MVARAHAEIHHLAREVGRHQDSLPMDVPFKHNRTLIGTLQRWLQDHPDPDVDHAAAAAGPSSKAPAEHPLRKLRGQAQAMLSEVMRKELMRPATMSAPPPNLRNPGERLAYAQARSELFGQMAQISTTQLPHLWTDDEHTLLQGQSLIANAHSDLEKFQATGQVMSQAGFQKMQRDLQSLAEDPNLPDAEERGDELTHTLPINARIEAERLLKSPTVRVMEHQINQPLARLPAELLLQVLGHLSQTDQPDLYKVWNNVRHFKSTSTAYKQFVESPQFRMLESLVKSANDLVDNDLARHTAENPNGLVTNLASCAGMMCLLRPETRESLVATVEQMPDQTVTEAAEKAMAIRDILPGIGLLDEGQKYRLVMAATGIREELPRSMAIGKLASSRHLSQTHLGKLLNAGNGIVNALGRAMVVAGFGSTLPLLDKDKHVPMLMTLARSFVYVTPTEPPQSPAEEEERLHLENLLCMAGAIAATGTAGRQQGQGRHPDDAGFLHFAHPGFLYRTAEGHYVTEPAVDTFAGEDIEGWHPTGLMGALEHLNTEDATEVMRAFQPLPESELTKNRFLEGMLRGIYENPTDPEAPYFMALKRIKHGFDPAPVRDMNELISPENMDKPSFRALADQAHRFPAKAARANQRAMLEKAMSQIRQTYSADQLVYEVERMNQDVRCKLDEPLTKEIDSAMAKMKGLTDALRKGLRDKEVPFELKEPFLKSMKSLQYELFTKGGLRNVGVSSGNVNDALAQMRGLVHGFVQGLPGAKGREDQDDKLALLTILNQRLGNFHLDVRREIFDATLGLTQESFKFKSAMSIDLAALEPDRALHLRTAGLKNANELEPELKSDEDPYKRRRTGVQDRCDVWFDTVMGAKNAEAKTVGLISLLNNLPSLRDEQIEQALTEAFHQIQNGADKKGLLRGTLGSPGLKYLDTAQKNALLAEFEGLARKDFLGTSWRPIKALQGLIDGMEHFDKDQRVRLFKVVMENKGVDHDFGFRALLAGGKRDDDEKPLKGLMAQFKWLGEPQQKILLALEQEYQYVRKSETLSQLALGGWTTIDSFFGVPPPT